MWQLLYLNKVDFRSVHSGNSLVVQCLGLGAFTAGAQVRSLVRELRSRKPRGVAKKKVCVFHLWVLIFLRKILMVFSLL